MTHRDAHLEPEHLRDAIDALDAEMRGVDILVDKSGADSSRADATMRASANVSAASVDVGR